jgi:chromosome segregation ATPase
MNKTTIAIRTGELAAVAFALRVALKHKKRANRLAKVPLMYRAAFKVLQGQKAEGEAEKHHLKKEIKSLEQGLKTLQDIIKARNKARNKSSWWFSK